MPVITFKYQDLKDLGIGGVSFSLKPSTKRRINRYFTNDV